MDQYVVTNKNLSVMMDEVYDWMRSIPGEEMAFLTMESSLEGVARRNPCLDVETVRCIRVTDQLARVSSGESFASSKRPSSSLSTRS